ncbi:MAG: hypothetical protein QM779_01615 [Propionicimonas sp.]|uniref:sugar ABC transporter substrate-binding protein n=1 Tax=Propionicimonas sp. TaxID=1955623 RepID=UPI003D0B3E0E
MATELLTTRRLRSLAALGLAGLVAASLAACSSGAATQPSATASAGQTADALSAEVAALTKPLDAYPVPTDTADASVLKGKTVYYVPITMQSPQFKITQKTVTDALTAVGATVQACDGKATPTDVSACITQATNTGAAAIITDAVPYVIAANAIDAARAAGIPVLITNQVASDKYPADGTLAYIPAGGGPMQAALAKWVTLDSARKANILINQGTDGPAPAMFVAEGKKVYASECPDCTVTINEVSSANFSLIPSSTSAALLKDPNIAYVESQFEQYLQPTQAGAEQAGRTDLKGLTGSVQLGGLQALASGNFLYAAAGQASAFQGWLDVDAAIRLVAKSELPEYTIPVRLFTRESISGVTLTDAAELSGEWYGPTTFTDEFKKIWGVA